MNPKRLACVQSSYIPWKGFFDLINSVDEFVLLDDVQFSRGTWRNRNRIKTMQGSKWLTIPVAHTGKFGQKINETCISDSGWNRRHLETIRQSYTRAPYFDQYRDFVEDLYDRVPSMYLSEVNYHFLEPICRLLGIATHITWSTNYHLSTDKNGRLIDLCKQVGARHYVSGAAAQVYIDEALFAEEGITVSYADYSNYCEYPQLFPPFDHYVSILDLIFNVGPTASGYALKGVLAGG